MTTCVLKRNPVWLASLPVSATSATIVLLGKDEDQVAVPAPLLLAASPLARSVLADLLPPAYSQHFLTLTDVAEAVLKLVGEILSSGIVTDVQDAHQVEEVKQVLVMLGIEPSLLCCHNENIKVENIENEGFDTTDNKEAIKLEITVETQDTLKDEDKRTQSLNRNIKQDNQDYGWGKTEIILCRLCQQHFTKIYSLKKHMDSVHKQLKFPCPLCAQKFSEKSKLSEHLKTIHKDKVGIKLPLNVSDELAKIIGTTKGKRVSRPQVVARLWAYVKKKNLQEPEMKQWFTPDKTMQPIFGKEMIQCTSMSSSKYLKMHLTNPYK